LTNNTILSLKNISKIFPGVKALDKVSIDFREGEVHSLLGENGAGKSTLIKILTGAYKANSGHIELFGKSYNYFTPHEAIFNRGISAIYQEFNLVPYLSVTENIYYGKEIKNGMFLDKKKMRKKSEDILNKLGIDINTDELVKNLSVAQKQIVEIAKAVSNEVDILIMDEPTAPLTDKEVKSLFNLVENLKKQKVTIIFISHKLEETLKISDRISVLRDGKLIKTIKKDNTDRKQLIKFMVGRTWEDTFPEKYNKPKGKLLEIDSLSTEYLKDINFSLRKGEILGIGGLVGSGRTEVARALFGLDQIIDGEIRINGEKAKYNSPKKALETGVGMIPEDRKHQGIINNMSVKENITFSILDNISTFKIIKKEKENRIVENFIKQLNIKTPSSKQQVELLSGGNQQKVVLSKWLANDCDILIFDEPTRGIDIGAKKEIYNLILDLSKRQKGIIFISSELPELINMTDRIIVMSEGRISGCVKKEDVSQEKIMDLATKNIQGGKTK